MKFDLAIQALGTAAWDWSEPGFASLAAALGLTREADADPELPTYDSLWGKEWVQAIVENGAVARVELLVAETAPRWRPFPHKKLQALGRKYRDKLAAYVKRANLELGEPAFFGDYGTPGWPDDEDGHALALWRLDTARLIVMARNAGPDTPFWISIIVKPLAPSRAQTARPSRPVMRAPTRPSAQLLDGARFDATLDTIASVRWDWSAADHEAILEKLAFPAIQDGKRIELTLSTTSPPPEGFTDEDAIDLDREYCEKHELYVQRVQRILGKPKFNDGMARKGYPEDEPGELCALWPLKTARVMLVYRGPEADDDPYRLSLVVKP